MNVRAHRPGPGFPPGGFSLVEMMLVTIIVALAVGMVLPAIRSRPAGLELENAARCTLGAVRFARNSAVARGVRHRLTFDREKSRFVVEAEDNPLKLPGEYQEIPLPHGLHEPFSSGRLEVAFDIPAARRSEQEAVDWITFHPDGSTEDTVIRLAMRELAREATIVIAGATGVSFLDADAVARAAGEDAEEEAAADEE